MTPLLGILCAVFLIINITSAENSCKTPDGWNGNCVALHQCRPLNRLLTRSISTKQRNFLRKSQCDGNATNPFVCCPNTFAIDDLPSNGKCGVQMSDSTNVGDATNVTSLDVTSINDFPWMALLHYRKSNGREGFFCGGVLIHENYVLTAAQCIRGRTAVRNRYILDSVRFGEYDLRTDPDCQENECADPVVDIPVAETIAHENYVSTSSAQINDIALIRLSRAAPYTKFIRPICLPLAESLQNITYDGSALTVARFVRAENPNRIAVKLKLDVNGFNLDQCSKIYRNVSSIHLNNRHLCACGEAGKGTCNGDSGSPLMANHDVDENSFRYLVGIVSLGPKHCGTPSFPDVYTRVDQYIEWILDHMKK